MRYGRGIEKEDKKAELPRMNEDQVREFTKRMKMEADEDGPHGESMPGLGFKM